VPTSPSRVTAVTDDVHELTVALVGSPGEVVTLHFADAAKDVAAPPAADTRELVEANRTYNAHPHSYCDDGKGPSGHVHAYTSNTDSLEQCQQHCDALSCTCFDYKQKHVPLLSASGETMYRCRVSTVATSLTQSGGGYTAYLPYVPPVPPPPPPAQLKTVSVVCKIGKSGTATASMPGRTCE